MIDLKSYPKFRCEALSLEGNIKVMVSKMDEVIASDSLTDAIKSDELQTLVDKYLP